MSPRVQALAALFVEHVFPPGTYRHDEFAEACADAVADVIGGTAWRVEGEYQVVLPEVAATIDLSLLFTRLRVDRVPVGSLDRVVREYASAALGAAGLVQGWTRGTP